MTGKDSRKKGSEDMGKIIINVPKSLLREFDNIAAGNSYSRSEAVKEAMRQFLHDNTPDDYIPEPMREFYNKSTKEECVAFWESLIDLGKKFPQQQQPQLPQGVPSAPNEVAQKKVGAKSKSLRKKYGKK